VSGPGVVDNNLQSASLEAGVFHEHARRASSQCLAYERVSVISWLTDRNEQLSWIEPAMIVGTA
jgi:hypothetical protein